MEDVNLRAIETLRREFKLPVGLSDHTPGITVPIAAVALGACVIEKHFTMDKNLPGPDHQASLEPHEFTQMVKAIRQVEKAMGDGNKTPTEGEKQIQKVARRSIVAAVNIPKGTIITEAMLRIKRPGTGIKPEYLQNVCGATAKVSIRSDELIRWEDLIESIQIRK